MLSVRLTVGTSMLDVRLTLEYRSESDDVTSDMNRVAEERLYDERQNRSIIVSITE
jgi:hypothetical protein